MIEEHTRPMTPEERSALAETVPPIPSRMAAPVDALTAGSAVALLTAVALMVLMAPLPAPSRIALIRASVPQGIFLGAGLVGAVVSWRRARAKAAAEGALWDDRRARVREDLEGGVVQLRIFHVTQAVRVAADEEAPRYLLRLADGRALFRDSSRWEVHEWERERTFPCTVIETARAMRSGRELGVRCIGSFLPPVSERPPFTDAEYDEDVVPSDGDVLDAERYERLTRATG